MFFITERHYCKNIDRERRPRIRQRFAQHEADILCNGSKHPPELSSIGVQERGHLPASMRTSADPASPQ